MGSPCIQCDEKYHFHKSLFNVPDEHIPYYHKKEISIF